MVTPVDGLAAAQTLLDYSRVDPGYCLKYVSRAYAAHGATYTGYWPTAYSGWLGSAGQHPGDWNPPAGVPVYFGPKASSSAGDVVISLGNGNCAATDWPYGGQTGQTTLAKRQQQIGRPYLGWTETILNFPILQVQPPAIPYPVGGNMFLIHNASNPTQYIVVSLDGGQLRGRFLEDPYERAVVLGTSPNLPVTHCDDPTFEGFLQRIGYEYAAPIPLLDVNAATSKPRTSDDPRTPDEGGNG